MQIRVETTKLITHLTKNRRSAEWSSCPKTTSKGINKPAIISSAMCRRSLTKNKCRRRWCRRSCKQIVPSRFSTSLLWGRFWCNWTNSKWPKEFQIATTVKWKYSCAVLGLAACHVSQNWNSRYVTPASQSHISHECSPLRWAISCKHEIAPLLISEKPMRSFTSVQMIHTHPSHIARFDFGRASLAGSSIHQLKWTCKKLMYIRAITSFRREIRSL